MVSLTNRAIYEEAIAPLASDVTYDHVVPWLMEHHPEIWRKIRDLDDKLGATLDEYKPVSFHVEIKRFVGMFQEAKKMWINSVNERK